MNEDKNVSDLWTFINDHNGCVVNTWGGYISKSDEYEPFGYTIDLNKEIHYFGLDGHFIKTNAQ